MAEIEQLINELKTGDTLKKRSALDRLASIGANVIHPLIEAVVNADDQHIGWTLEGYDWERGEGQKSGFNQLQDTSECDYWYVPAATFLLIKLREISLTPIRSLLTHDRAIVRTWSTYILGEIGSQDVIPSLVACLHTDDPGELMRLAEALGKLHATTAVERLIELLDNDDSGVQSFAAEALGRIGDMRALIPLVKQLKQHKPSIYSVSAALHQFGEDAVLPQTELLFDPEAKPAYGMVLQNLWMLGDKRAIEPILRFLENAPDNASKHRAIGALGYLRAEQAVVPIADTLHNAPDFDQSWVAAMALAKIGNKQAFNVLAEELRNGIPQVQHSAALAIGEMNAVEDIEPLLAALKDPNPHIRSAAAVSLGNLHESRATVALTDALGDPDQATRQFAANALEKIAGQSR